MNTAIYSPPGPGDQHRDRLRGPRGHREPDRAAAHPARQGRAAAASASCSPTTASPRSWASRGRWWSDVSRAAAPRRPACVPRGATPSGRLVLGDVIVAVGANPVKDADELGQWLEQRRRGRDRGDHGAARRPAPDAEGQAAGRLLSMARSLWLAPPEPSTPGSPTLIAELAAPPRDRGLRAPRHAAGGIVAREDALLSGARRLASRLRPFERAPRAPTGGSLLPHCVFVEAARPRPDCSRPTRGPARRSPRLRGEPFRPHLSLVYGLSGRRAEGGRPRRRGRPRLRLHLRRAAASWIPAATSPAGAGWRASVRSWRPL